jgi:hypothetical protein
VEPESAALIKVADLIKDRDVLPKSTIRRDMFGNLRAAPKYTRIEPEQSNDGFTETLRKPSRDIDPLLDPHLYVAHVTRVAKSADARQVRQARIKFSGRQRALRGYWNPYLMMDDGRKYAQLANPYM